MKRKFNLDQLRKLHALSTHELQCIKGGNGNSKDVKKEIKEIKGGGLPPAI